MTPTISGSTAERCRLRQVHRSAASSPPTSDEVGARRFAQGRTTALPHPRRERRRAARTTVWNTREGSRKRTSVFAGWTLTSTMSRPTSTKSTAAGFGSKWPRARYASVECLRQTAVLHRPPVHVGADVRPCAALGRDRARRSPRSKSPAPRSRRRRGPRPHRGPSTAATRSSVEAAGGSESTSRPSARTVKPTVERAMARSETISTACRSSVDSARRNFRRAGISAKRFLTSTVVPTGCAAGFTGSTREKATETTAALGGFAGAARDQKLRDAADRRQGLPAEAARRDVLEVGGVSQLRGGMPLDRERQVGRGNALRRRRAPGSGACRPARCR